ncbi:MAG: apolipoprotein N-acyltransferase, partial [Ruminococcaceae bacterium]|nr:apolipoprotein N-acyltransferase [Oscillospiraceae bacterium]
AALGIYLANTVLGIAVYAKNDALSREGIKVTVGIVQGNYSSAEKWSASPPEIVDKYIRYTKLAAEEGAELIVWPETALPFVISEGTVSSNRIAITARDLGVTILVGTITEEGEDEYNAVLCYMPDGSINETYYKKRHLVPFGEFVPMKKVVDIILPFLSDIAMLKDPMTPGTDTEIIDTDLCRIGALICFDSIYESSVLETVRDGAQIITLSTNDSWFTDSAGIYMHNNQARLRAIETGKYVVRSANTGLSAIISPSGSVVKDMPIMEEGIITADVYANDGATLYTMIGNSFVYLSGLFAFSPLAVEAYLSLKEFINRRFSKQSLTKTGE